MGKTCLKCGHTLDDSWDECPYCIPTQIRGTEPGDTLPKHKGTISESEFISSGSRKKTQPPGRGTGKARRTVIASEEEAPLAGWLVVIKGQNQGEVFNILKRKNTIGAVPDECDIVIFDDLVSKSHASIRYTTDGKYFITDLDSSNSTFLNNEEIQKSELKDGDKIKIGKSVLVFKSFDPNLFD